MKQTLQTLPASVKIDTLLADAGYDSEANHRHAREKLGMKTLIPPFNGRGRWLTPRTPYRLMMHKAFANGYPPEFGKRWQVETAFSMIKRNLGSALSGRNYWSHGRQMRLKAIIHNLMIIAKT